MNLVLLLTLFGAIYLGILPIFIYIVPILVRRKVRINDVMVIKKINMKVLILPLILVLLDLFAILTCFYLSNLERTLIGLFKLLWFPGIVNAIITGIIYFSALGFYYSYNNKQEKEFYVNGIVIVATACVPVFLALCLGVIGWFGPKQEFVPKETNVELELSINKISDKRKVFNSVGLGDWGAFDIQDGVVRKVNGDFIITYKLTCIQIAESNSIIPGYITPEGDSYKLVPSKCFFDKSYYLSKDSKRIARTKYPSLIITDMEFDIGDNNVQYELFLYREKRFSTNQKDDFGIIAVNLFTGEAIKYKNSEIPQEFDFTTVIIG